MRRSQLAALLLLGLCGACGKSCACGKSGGEAAAAATRGPARPASQGTSQETAGTPVAGQVDGGVVVTRRAAVVNGPDWEPAPPSALTQRLAASKQAIETDRVYDALANDKSLGVALSDQLGKLKATGTASSSTRQDDATKLAVVARDYKAGSKSVRVKITDTALMPEARHAVSGRLTLVGNAEVGHEHGTFVSGSPALVANLDAQHISRVTALVSDRYLVQIIVRGADKPDEAALVLEKLDLSGIASQSKK